MNREQLREFGRLALATFKEPLAAHGFKRESKKTETYFCTIVFVNGTRYVKIDANIHFRDYPPYFNIVLGEGGRDFFEADWNSIPLWRLKSHIQRNEPEGEYSLEVPENVPALIDRACKELLEFGSGFLDGDVEAFRQARAEQNKSRPPYQVYVPNAEGMYTVCDEPVSVKMKAKFS